MGEQMRIELETDGLVLRPWRDEDAEPVYRACQDPAIQRWSALPSPYRMSDAQALIDSSCAAWRDGTGALMGVFDQASGDLVGSCSVGAIRDGSGWLGYWVAPWARNHGIATRACRAVATFAFEHLGLVRLLWQAEIGNHASHLVALRTGFRIDGEWRYAHPHQQGRREAWVGTLLPDEVTAITPDRYATGSLEARRAAIFGAPHPALPLAGAPRPAPLLAGITQSELCAAGVAQPELATGGAAGRLRAWQANDLPQVTAACQDPESARWTTVPAPYSEDHARQFIYEHTPVQWARGSSAIFAIADERDEYVGSIDLRIDPEDEQSAEVGYLVAPWARGHGYATAAVRTLCSWGFAALGLSRIVWKAYVGNDASRRVAEKSGFTIEGIQRAGCAQRGERVDSWVGSLLP